MRSYWLLVITMLLGIVGAGRAWGAGTPTEIASLKKLPYFAVLVNETTPDDTLTAAGCTPEMMRTYMESRLRDKGITLVSDYIASKIRNHEEVTLTIRNYPRIVLSTVTIKDDKTDRYLITYKLDVRLLLTFWGSVGGSDGPTWQSYTLLTCESTQMPKAPMAYLDTLMTMFLQDYATANPPKDPVTPATPAP